MTKITSSGVLHLFMLGVLAVGAPVAAAQRAPNPMDDKDPGTGCLPYNLDVVSLVSNNVQMFWKQTDCIVVHVTNNPFLFKYDLTFNEQLIKEDDPLSAFGGKFGLNTSSVKGSGSTHDTSTDAAVKAEQPTGAPSPALVKVQNAARNMSSDPALSTQLVLSIDNLQKLRATAPRSIYLEQKTRTLDSAETQVKKDAKANKDAKPNDNQKQVLTAIEDARQAETTTGPAPEQLAAWKTRVDGLDGLKSQSNKIKTTLDAKISSYNNFSAQVNNLLMRLSDQAAKPDDIEKGAQALRDKAIDEVKTLSEGDSDSDVASPAFEEEMVVFAQNAADLHEQLAARQPSASDDSDEAQTLRTLLNEVHEQAGAVVFYACRYKVKLDNDFSSIRTGLLDPLDKVLVDGVSFGYTIAAKKREGPFGDPTAVTMTLTRDKVQPFTTGSGSGTTPQNVTASFTCSSDTSDLFDHGATYTKFDDFFTDKPAIGIDNPTNKPTLYTRNGNKPQQTPTQQTPAPSSKTANPPAKPATTDNTVLVQPWFFGKARLVLTGGLSVASLTKTEFQRSSSISGTVIGLKTDTRFRFTPMLYGHTLLYSGRHDSDAWYATLGVTSNSDDKGTDPEFLAGFSRSFAQQKFFVTAGAYFGERQKLDGGLYVGEAIPTSLTGDLPVTKSYHVGWAFGLSYRFASTKDPTNNQSKQKTATNKGTN
jgi:hypothetical protein